MEITYSVPAMSCAHCERAIRMQLFPIPGVSAVDVDLTQKLVTVTGEELDDAKLQQAIEGAGYEIAPR